ncbi:TraI domain-containing protein, partial [Azotobacter beijerinckii]
MFLSFLKRWLFGDNYASLFAEAPHPAERLIPPELRPYLENHNWRNLRYPPYQEGYPGKVTGEWLMRHYQRKLIDRIAGSIGLPKDEYQRYVEPILINFAELAHLLPASEHHHHAGPG